MIWSVGGEHVCSREVARHELCWLTAERSQERSFDPTVCDHRLRHPPSSVTVLGGPLPVNSNLCTWCRVSTLALGRGCCGDRLVWPGGHRLDSHQSLFLSACRRGDGIHTAESALMGKRSKKDIKRGLDQSIVNDLLETRFDPTAGLAEAADADIFVQDAATEVADAHVPRFILLANQKSMKSTFSIDEPLLRTGLRAEVPAAPSVQALRMARTLAEGRDSAGSAKPRASSEHAVFDLWGGASAELLPAKMAKMRRRPSSRPAIAVPGSELSYHPDPVVYQNALGAATRNEEIHQRRMGRNAVNVSAIMKMRGRGFEDDIQDGITADSRPEPDPEPAPLATPLAASRKKKGTHAHNHGCLRPRGDGRARTGLKQPQRSRPTRGSILEIASELSRENQRRQARELKRALLKQKYKQMKIFSASRPRREARSFDLPLPEELAGGSLRLVRGDNLLLRDRLRSLRSRNLIFVKTSTRPRVRTPRVSFTRYTS